MQELLFENSLLFYLPLRILKIRKLNYIYDPKTNFTFAVFLKNFSNLTKLDISDNFLPSTWYNVDIFC
jgi:hypothetical protein